MTEGDHKPICTTVLPGWEVGVVLAGSHAQNVSVEDGGETGVLPLTPSALAKLLATLGRDDWEGRKVDVEIRIYRKGEGP